ncbi:MAG: 3-dehydroquinate synthase, partial [Gammaproteobacteria bacterium]|nr:3-dehydroquinate synthase [Gammaproteobacteria bacterium]
LSARHGWLSDEAVTRTEKLLQQASLPTCPPDEMDAARFLELMAVDKKVVDGGLRLVLLRAVGDAFLSSDFDADLLDKTLAAA